MAIVKHKYLFCFPEGTTETPIIYRFVKDFDLIVNIFRANISNDGEGYLVLELEGEEEKITAAKSSIAQCGVTVSTVDKGVLRNSEKCTNCGNCLSHCPTHALHIDDVSKRNVLFNEKLCVACGRCVSNCPMGACSMLF